MPCNTARQVTLVWGENTDLEVLADALKTMGYDVDLRGTWLTAANSVSSLMFMDGKMKIASYYGDVFNEETCRNLYSQSLVKAKMKKFGWKMESKKKNRSGNDEFIFVKG